MRWPDLGNGVWAFKRTLAYLRPVGWVLCGVLIEASRDRDAGYVWSVKMPLYVPTDVVNLSWSDRVGGGSAVFEYDTPERDAAIAEAASEARARHIQQPTVALDPPGGTENVLMQEARAYGLLVSGDLGSAAEVLGRVLRYEAQYGWELEMKERATAVSRLLDGGRSKEALVQIREWRRATIMALGLSE